MASEGAAAASGPVSIWGILHAASTSAPIARPADRCVRGVGRGTLVLVSTSPYRSRELVPPGLARPAANYAHAVLSEDVRRLLHTSGVVPTRPDGSVAESLAEQAATVWSTLQALLGEAGMTVENVVSVTTYVVVGEDLSVVMAARDEALGGHRAASTLVTVPALAQPAWLMEIAIVATA
jgi:2-iminobutanoate/2-iminopropanoate deaminase